MNLKPTFPSWLLLACVLGLLAGQPAFADQQVGAGDGETIVSTTPMRLAVEEGAGVHGQLVVAREVIGDGQGGDLVYTITVEPRFGQVGLAGGDDEDFFQTKTARLGYFAYRPSPDYVGEDSFSYTVRSETSGLVFRNEVVIQVHPRELVVLERMEITEDRARVMDERAVALTTRPNVTVTRQVPSHEDFIPVADRAASASRKVVYALIEEAKPRHGTARLDRDTGLLTYAPNPGFIGEDRFHYYTSDESNPQLGMENIVVVTVEPIRDAKRLSADRSKSRQVDLVFVINNSPSMAPHQDRIAANLRRFRQLFDERGLDYRIGVLTTDFVNVDPGRRSEPHKSVRSVEIDAEGNPVLDRKQRPRVIKKQVASNGRLVTLPVLPQPWVTPQTPDGIFAELVKVGTNGDSNRTAFTAVYNFVAGFQNDQHTMLRPDATTIVVFFMDEEETRMATWQDLPGGGREARWIEDGQLPELLKEYNRQHPDQRQTLDRYINTWVLRPFIIVKGNKRGKIEMHAVVSPANVSHRRAAELTGGTVLNIEDDFSEPLAALGDRIADTVAVALEPVAPGSTLHKPSLRVLVDGQEVPSDPANGWIYDARTHSIRFQGAAKKQAFTAKIEITYEEHR